MRVLDCVYVCVCGVWSEWLAGGCGYEKGRPGWVSEGLAGVGVREKGGWWVSVREKGGWWVSRCERVGLG